MKNSKRIPITTELRQVICSATAKLFVFCVIFLIDHEPLRAYDIMLISDIASVTNIDNAVKKKLVEFSVDSEGKYRQIPAEKFKEEVSRAAKLVEYEMKNTDGMSKKLPLNEIEKEVSNIVSDWLSDVLDNRNYNGDILYDAYSDDIKTLNKNREIEQAKKPPTLAERTKKGTDDGEKPPTTLASIRTLAEPPVSGDPQPPVSGDPAPPVSGDPQPPVSGDPQPPVSGDPAPGWINADQLFQAEQRIEASFDQRFGGFDQRLGAFEHRFDTFERNVDRRFRKLHREIRRNRREAHEGIALSLATANLRYVDEPGVASFAMGGGHWHDQTGLALGLGYTTPDGDLRLNASLAGAPGSGNLGVGVGVSLRLN